jgi:hypothetical protein
MTSPSDDENKPIDLKQFKRRRAMASHNVARKKLTETTWRELCALWARYAGEAPKLPDTPSGLRLYADADAIFSVLLEDLISVAQAHGVNNEDIIEILCSFAIVLCEPKGRLYELLDLASRVTKDGDEQ